MSTRVATEAVKAGEGPRFSWPQMYLGALGLAISLYAFLVHRRIEAGEASGCPITTEHISCDRVLGSHFGKLFGIPLGAYGMAYFAVMILLAVSTNPNSSPAQERLLRLIWSALGVVATGVLSYISYRIIGAACPICMATHATILATFGVSLWQFLKLRNLSP